MNVWPIVGKLRTFNHPLVDDARTQLYLKMQRDYYLALRLFDRSGNYVIEDRPIAPGFSLPGLALTLKPAEREVRIDNIYLQPSYHGKRIGSDFVDHLVEAARENRARKISLIADAETAAAGYWKKMGFRAADPYREMYFERIL